MMEMKRYKLSEIASFIGSGITPLRSNEKYWNSKDYPWLKTEQLGEYQIFDTNEYISKVALEETNLKLFPKNTLSVAMYGEGKTRGNVSILAEQMTTNQACCNIIVDNKFANYKFVYYWLKNSYYKLRSLSSGIRNNLNTEDIKKFEINLPSLPTQQKIAAILSSLDDKIALNKKINTKLEAMAKRLYDYWFVQFDYPDKNGKPYKTSGGKMVWNEVLKRKIPEGWEVGKIGDFVETITKGSTPSTVGFEFEEVGINFVKVECIENGYVLTDNLMHISEEANHTLKRSQLQENDILVTIAGRLGSSAIVSKDILPANTNQAVGIIRLKKEYKFLVNYLYQRIVSTDMQIYLQSINAQSIQKNLTLPNLANIIFAYDKDFNLINCYNEKILPIFNYQLTIQKEIQKLTKLRDRLLPLLMNGQVEVEE